MELLDFLILPASVVLILLPLGFFFFELCTHLFDLILELAHPLIVLSWHARSFTVEGIIKVLSNLTCLRHFFRRFVVLPRFNIWLGLLVLLLLLLLLLNRSSSF